MRNQLLLIVMVMMLGVSGRAWAQPADSTPAAKLQLARRLYDEGVDAVDKGSWSIAYDRFKASYELAPRVLTLFNLAGAQGQTGRLIEAAENYRRFLRETGDGRYAELRTQATTQLDLLEKQLAQVRLEVVHLEPDDVVAIDEVEFPHAALREAIPMNPGPHVARVQRGATVLATRTLSLASGATESLRIDLPVKQLDLELHASGPAPDPGALGPERAPSRPVRHGASHAWLRSPWLWSSVAAVVAGGATGAYLLTRPDGLVVH